MRRFARLLILPLIVLLAGCSFADHGFLAAAGPVAAAERDHFYSIIGWTLIVIVPLYVALPVVLWKYRIGKNPVYRPQWAFSWILEGLIWGLPLVIVAILGVNLWQASNRLDPYSPIASADQPPLEVQAISLDWKWLFIYPKQDVAAANKLVLPAGRPVHFRLTSATVMQSFIIPRLGGQIYTMPGMVSQLSLLAHKPGRFMGENTQYNGRGFAKQKFTVHVVKPAAFDKWVTQVQQTRPPLDDAAYVKIAQRSVLDAPITYGSVPAGFFQRLINRIKTVPAGETAGAKPEHS